MKDLKPYKFKKDINGNLYVTLKIPVKSWVDATMEIYGDEDNQYYGEDYEYGVDDVIRNAENQNIKKDLELFKRLGWEVVDVLDENIQE